jgi:D-glycero-beta-D-manno-heptose 1-phosphate adenylyltransferase
VLFLINDNDSDSMMLASKKDPFSQVGFLQFEIVTADIRTNLEQLKVGLRRLNPVPGSLIGLPEMWATGFVYEQLGALCKEIPALLEELEELARSYGVVLAGSLPEQKVEGEETVLYNTLFFSGIGAAGSHGISKQHLFSFWKEDVWFRSGRRAKPVSVDGDGLVGGLVCYDLRFPEVAQFQCRQGADLLLVPAQWPLARIEQWKILLQARAIENQVFIVAVNGCGSWEGLQMGGHSLVIAPDGEILAEAGEETASALVTPNWEVARELRARFNTVAPVPWSGDDGDKIFSLDTLAEVVANRMWITCRRLVGREII